MHLLFDVFSKPQRLSLTRTERKLWLAPLLQFLSENPNRVGEVLLGKQEGRWNNQDVRNLEKLILSKVTNTKAIEGYLSILHEAAHLWSVIAREKVKLPRFVVRSRKVENPFRFDYATAVAQYCAWKDELSVWIDTVSHHEGAPLEKRDLLSAAFLVSAILYGGVFGVPFLVAIAGAIANKKQTTFAIGGRIHIELSLTLKGVADAEKRVWLPDALSATLWDKLESSDVNSLLVAVVEDGRSRPPHNGEIYRRMGRLIKQTLAAGNDRQLPGIEVLRRCAREVAISKMDPALVEYGNTRLLSNSLPRREIGRLFPTEKVIEFNISRDPHAASALEPEQMSPSQNEAALPSWIGALLVAAHSKSPIESLSMLAKDSSCAASLRLIADFGLSLLSSTSVSGKRMRSAKVESTVLSVARSLGCLLDRQDLAALEPEERRSVYLEAINSHPAAKRQKLIVTILEFDLYLVAQKPTTYPVLRSSFPWLPKAVRVDANLITHFEYFEILRKIDTEWPAKSGESRKQIALLIVVLAFRCGLRRSEIRRLRMADVLIRGTGELQIRPRKDDPLKTRNAKRRIPIDALLSPEELEKLRAWYNGRVQDHATSQDYLFAVPEQEMAKLPNLFFEDVNEFLRRATNYVNLGRGIHLHHLRHAFGSWLFVSFILSGLEPIPSLFPSLLETNEWLARGKLIHQAIFNNPDLTKKDPFMIAYLSGHASFDTTAGSYIHLFPWLLAAFLDRSETMIPDEDLVKRASGVPDATFRRWLREDGIHNIPLRIFKRSVGATRPPANENINKLDANLQSAGKELTNDWLNPAWNELLVCCKNEATPCANPFVCGRSARGNHLQGVVSEDGRFRHPMESFASDKRSSVVRLRLACPLKPPHTTDIVPFKLLTSIEILRGENPELLTDALKLFVERLEEGAFLRFNSIVDLAKADRYIEFLRRLGVSKRKIEIVSGDPNGKSPYRREWSQSLSETYLLIEPCGGSRNFGPKSSISIRPSTDPLQGIGTGPAGFRFAMAMAFIVFGNIQD